MFLTNGNGVAFSADPVYRSLLQELDSGLAAVALRSFTDAVIANRLQFSLTDLRGTPVAAATSDLVDSASERSRRIRRPSAARKARRARTRRPGSGPPATAGRIDEGNRQLPTLRCDRLDRPEASSTYPTPDPGRLHGHGRRAGPAGEDRQMPCRGIPRSQRLTPAVLHWCPSCWLPQSRLEGQLTGPPKPRS